MGKMEMITYFMVFLLSLKGLLGFNTETQIVSEVINSYERPTAVVAKVCWGISDKKKFAAELISTENARTIQFTDGYESLKEFTGKDMLIILDLNCRDSKHFLKQAGRSNKFEKPYRWLLISTESMSNDIIPSALKNLSILVDSEVMVVRLSRNDEKVKGLIYRVYRIDITTDFIPESFGTWTLSKGLEISNDTKIPVLMRRRNLKGKPVGIAIVTVDNTTRNDIYKLSNFKTDNIAKTSFHVILPLYDFMNATPKILFTDTWGYSTNNSYNGMIGHIMRGDADLCGVILLMRLYRVEMLSFLAQPVRTNNGFVFREPPLSLQNNLFILPFKSTVWMCIGALFLILVFIIYANAKWETVKEDGMKCDDPTILRPNLSDVLIYIAGAVVQQGSNIELKGSLGRVVTLIMFLIFLFLYASYSANIVALLQSSSDQIRTLSDLLSSKFELGVEDQPYTRHYFSTATDRVRKAIFDNKIARTGYKPNFMPIEEGVKKLQNLNEPFAFHMNLGLGYRFIEQYFHEHEKCGLSEIEYIQNGSPWACCRKQSPYKEIYKIGLTRTIEHGIADRINRLVYVRKPSCTTRSSSFGSVNMVDFRPVLLCLLYGMLASVLLLILEILIYRKQQRLKPDTSVLPNSCHSAECGKSDTGTWRLD